MTDTDSSTLTQDECPNCSAVLQGDFCYHCGQNQKHMNRFFLSLISEAFEDIFSVKSRLALTLAHLFFRPGLISNEYTSGRKARYVAPLRLYIVTSVILVLVLSIQNALAPDDANLPISITTDGGVTDIKDVIASENALSDADVVTNIETNVSKIELPLLSSEGADKFRELLKVRAEKTYKTLKGNPGEIKSLLLDVLPPLMFILLPIFAALLKLTYLFSGRYYTEHLIFALHSHCFIYIAIICMEFLWLFNLIDGLAGVADFFSIALSIWLPFYLFRALRVFYRGSLTMAILKSIFLSFSYTLLLSATFMVALVWGFFTL